ncbi:deneddylase [Parasponia andersonii]|uniref:Deneddylase n=1 Tax=Parasponia andersonii TaxID=3476 RepID=A0A2P5DXC4_PARAD|nr:deneddylase [Parasponia andersonii]
MAFVYSRLSLHNPLLPVRPRFVLVHPKPHRAFFPKLPLWNPPNSLPILARSSPNAVPAPGTEQEVLRAVVDSDERTLPCVRAYESDLARLTLVGAVDLEQALTAAAADGGQAAAEHLDSGMPAMVVETLYPGGLDPHSTVSTRLFLPTGKVLEKARRLRSSLTEDILSGATPKNILAMTFRQVVLQQLWSFELVIFRPGTERNMDDLENPREVSASFTLRSSDEKVISVLAEAVCISALQSTERNFVDSYLGRSSSNLFHWLQKPRRIVSKDSSVIITKLFEDEIVENAKSLLESNNSIRAHFKPVKNNLKYSCWTPSGHSKLEKIGGPQFSAWTSEYIPAYKIQIDADRPKDVKFEGWRKSLENRWEVCLTHSQMVGLSDIIDMYYEDLYTLPSKELSCGVVRNYTNLSDKKRNSLMLKMLSVTVASGIFVIAISALGQLCFPRLKLGKYSWERRSLPASEVESVLHVSLDDAELEAFCISVIRKIKDALGWPGDIITERNVGVWTGKLPEFLKVEDDSNSKDMSTNIDAEIKTSAQDIASYQVVLSLDGKLVGFQPMSRVAVNQWAANPLAKELYGGRKLSPGLIERGLKIHRPDGVVVLELLMSIKRDASFALARPSR